MMNPTKSKTVFEEREELRVQLLSTQNMLVAEQRHTRRLDAQLTAVEELLRGLTAELQATRKVAQAAAVYLAAVDSFGKSQSAKEYFDSYNPANEELRAAITEYRALTAPEPFFERPGAVKGLEGLVEMEGKCL